MGARIAIYARTSTDDQADRGTIDIQLRDCRKWVEREGHYVVAEFRDDGVSGATAFDEREGGADLLARADEFDRVVIYSVDRLARDTVEGGLALKALARAKLAVTFVTIQLDLETPEGVMILDQMLSFAKYERAVIQRRTTKGRRKSAAAGHWPASQVPYSFRRVDGRLRVRLSEARALRRMIRMVLDQDMGSTVIAKDFNKRSGIDPRVALDFSQGVKADRKAAKRLTDKDASKAELDRIQTRVDEYRQAAFEKSGVPLPDKAFSWWPSTVNELLQKSYYFPSTCDDSANHGYRKDHGHIEYVGTMVPCPVLIRKEEGRKIKDVFKLRKERSPRNVQTFHLLRSLLYCRECENVYHTSTHRGQKVAYCGARRQGRINGHSGQWYYKAAYLEHIIKRKVLTFLLSPAETIKRNQAYIESVEAGSDADREKAGLRDDLTTLADERKRVLMLYRKGHVNERDTDKDMAEITASKERVDKRLAELEAVTGNVIDPDAWHWIGQPWESKADVEDKTVLYRLLLGDLRIAEENVDVVLNKERYSPQDWRELIDSVLERAWVAGDGSVSVVFAGSASSLTRW